MIGALIGSAWGRAAAAALLFAIGYGAWRYESWRADRLEEQVRQMERRIVEMESEMETSRYEAETNATASEVERAMDRDLPVRPGPVRL